LTIDDLEKTSDKRRLLVNAKMELKLAKQALPANVQTGRFLSSRTRGSDEASPGERRTEQELDYAVRQIGTRAIAPKAS
jgi:hypothetical protein